MTSPDMSAINTFSGVWFTPDIFLGGGVLAILITLFGWYMAYKIRRPLMFRVKLALVYLLPLTLAGTYLCPWLDFSHTYRMLLIYTFIILQSILYWREVRKMTTSIGYHKSVLVSFLDMVPDMVWMKDIDGQFTYTNKATCDILLKCTPEEAFGKTGKQIAEQYVTHVPSIPFGAMGCATEDSSACDGKVCRSLEIGTIDGELMALQVFRATLHVELPNGSTKLVGTIGMGRDLTYDYIDHERIYSLFSEGKTEEALEAFAEHRKWYASMVGCTNQNA